MKPIKLLTGLLYAALAAALVYGAGKWLLPLFAPFILSYAAAAALEPAVGALCRRGWKRGAASGLCLIAALGATGGLLYALISRLSREAAALFERLPEIIGSFTAALDRGQAALGAYFERSGGLGGHLAERIELWDALAELPGIISERLLALVSALAGAAPSAMLFTVTAVIGVYFVSSSYPQAAEFIKERLPPRILAKTKTFGSALKSSLGSWLKAQLIMMLITFFALAAAFALLGVDYPLGLALFTAAIDALPVFGAGTVLLPWALWELLGGSRSLAAGLAVSYGCVTLLRNCVQPKLLGDQLGLHPALSLISIYAGYRVWGIWGMLSFPLLTVVGIQLWKSGLGRLFINGGENDDGYHIQYNSGNGDEHSGRYEHPAG